jgi:saxitoxin biosynthesis operon SxtJ-like protein
MALIHVTWRPGDRQLRVFAAAAILVASAVGARLHGAGAARAAVVAWAIAGSCLVLAIARPALLRPLYVGLTVVTMPLGYAVSYAALVVLYFGVIMPIGLVLRLCGRDVMGRRRDRAAATYWHPRDTRRSPERYFRLY